MRPKNNMLSKLCTIPLILLCGSLTSTLKAEPTPVPNGNDLEYYLLADRTTYQLGETVFVTHTITNPLDVPVDVEFRQQPGFNLWVMQGDSTIYIEYPFGLQVIWTRTFAPNEILEFDYTWDMTDNDGNTVLPGEYDLVGVIHGHGRNVSTNITIVPEPATVMLFALGAIIMHRRDSRREIG